MDDSLREKVLRDQAERDAPPLSTSLLTRVFAAAVRGFEELFARLRASLWLIVAVAVIMLSLVVLAHLSLPFAVAAVLGFV